MGHVLNFFSKLTGMRLIPEGQFEELIDQAVEKAVFSERTWHNKKDPSFDDSIDDLFHLYHSIDIDTDKLTPEQKRIYERWIGSRTGMGLGIDLAHDQPLDYLFLMQKVVKSKYYSDPHARSILNNWTFYTVGGGLKVLMPTDELQKYVNKFRLKNKMIKREKAFTRSLYQNGELFIAYYIDSVTGDVQLRRIRPDEIIEIECHSEDIENIFSFHCKYDYIPSGSLDTMSKDVWVKSLGYDDYLKLAGGFSKERSKNNLVKNPQIQFIKLGDDTELRGRVPMQPVLRLLKSYEDWLDDRIRLNHERAKVVWIKEIKGRSQEASKRERRSPRGGIMLTENENVKYRIENPQLHSDQAKEDGLQILYTIGAGTSLPIHILNQRSDEQAYASIRKADTPFSQYIRTHQEILGEEFESMYRFVLKAGVESGALSKNTKIPIFSQESLIKAFERINVMYLEEAKPETIIKEVKDELKKDFREESVDTIEVPISIDFPEIIREDLKAQAEVLKIHKELGIASRATLSAKAGYNWKQEFALMKMEITGDGTRDDKDHFDGDEKEDKSEKDDKSQKDDNEE